jgi:DNA-binding Lrp family transcriptional regulator
MPRGNRKERTAMASAYNQPQHFSKYLKFLDKTNAKILNALARHGPRNISVLAKATSLPVTTVRFRLGRMVEKGLLLVTINPNLPKLGLAKAFVIADAKLGHHDHLMKTIENADYWTYIIRCYGRMDGYCAYFAFPAERKQELESYFEEASSLGIFSEYRLLWTTNSYYATPDFAWYDFKEKRWDFRWQEWISAVVDAPEELPHALREARSHEIMADETDLLTIKELQKDAAVDLRKLSEILEMTPQSVGNRFQKHIVGRNLITNYNVDVYPFPIEVSDLYCFVIDFDDEKALARFINGSYGKPFVVSFAKAMSKNLLIANLYVLKEEFSGLIRSLNCLYSEGLVKDFYYTTLDPSSYRSQTISYKYFENGKWTYNLEERIGKLKEIRRRR